MTADFVTGRSTATNGYLRLEQRQSRRQHVRADASAPPRLGAGAAHLDIGRAISQRDLRLVDFFGALDARTDDGAVALDVAYPAPLDERSRFLERGPAADFNEKIGGKLKHYDLDVRNMQRHNAEGQVRPARGGKSGLQHHGGQLGLAG